MFQGKYCDIYNKFISYYNDSRHLKSTKHLYNSDSSVKLKTIICQICNVCVPHNKINRHLVSNKYFIINLKSEKILLTEELNEYKIKFEDLLIKYNNLKIISEDKKTV